jgi:hypothetical protein
MRWIVLFAAFSVTAPAAAAPVYLHCTIDEAKLPFDVTLDEEKGTAAFKRASDLATVPASFTVDEASYEENLAGIVRVKTRINRKTLEVTSLAQVSGKPGEPRHGQCEIVKAVENKF